DPVQRLHERRVLVVVVEPVVDVGVGERARRVPEEIAVPLHVQLGGVEVVALVAGEALARAGGSQHRRGGEAEQEGEQPVAARPHWRASAWNPKVRQAAFGALTSKRTVCGAPASEAVSTVNRRQPSLLPWRTASARRSSMKTAKSTGPSALLRE